MAASLPTHEVDMVGLLVSHQALLGEAKHAGKELQELSTRVLAVEQLLTGREGLYTQMARSELHAAALQSALTKLNERGWQLMLALILQGVLFLGSLAWQHLAHPQTPAVSPPGITTRP